jgi:hypothetical protein
MSHLIDISGGCPLCGHPWNRHGCTDGCSVLVDSAYTVSNTRECGCSNDRGKEVMRQLHERQARP